MVTVALSKSHSNSLRVLPGASQNVWLPGPKTQLSGFTGNLQRSPHLFDIPFKGIPQCTHLHTQTNKHKTIHTQTNNRYEDPQNHQTTPLSKKHICVLLAVAAIWDGSHANLGGQLAQWHYESGYLGCSETEESERFLNGVLH